MNAVELKVKKLYPDVQLPEYATDGAICFDLRAYFPDGVARGLVHKVHRGETAGFQTGLSFEVPEGYGLLIFSRSGQGFKYDVSLSNGTGLIDRDYIGEVSVSLTRAEVDHDAFHEDYEVRHGDRIAQAALIPMPVVKLVEVEKLTSSTRGAGGIGSTGAA